MIELRHVSKTYTQGDTNIEVLRDVSLTVSPGERVAIVGASGSGKSTLLSLMSGMDIPDVGAVLIDGIDTRQASEVEISRLRNKYCGVIFQSFELVPSFTALENVMLPLDIRRTPAEAATLDALKRVGLGARVHHTPSMLSGGEEQRVAIARTLAQEPTIVFADEPTGNLDQKTGREILELLEHVVSDAHRALVIITHDMSIADRMDRILLLGDGTVRERHK